VSGSPRDQVPLHVERGCVGLVEPARASEAAGEAVSLELDGSASGGPLDPATALRALLVAAVMRGLDAVDLGAYDVRWTGGSVTLDPLSEV